ncbi:hypothetical protein [Helicobacter felis]|uniref:hypothetical protein n=1 Tax=Helicobacter felis TaxID=214 RepID=UPI0013152F00|nr:hypothetical protein [Helicobacter felis]
MGFWSAVMGYHRNSTRAVREESVMPKQPPKFEQYKAEIEAIKKSIEEKTSGV